MFIKRRQIIENAVQYLQRSDIRKQLWILIALGSFTNFLSLPRNVLNAMKNPCLFILTALRQASISLCNLPATLRRLDEPDHRYLNT